MAGALGPTAASLVDAIFLLGLAPIQYIANSSEKLVYVTDMSRYGLGFIRGARKVACTRGRPFYMKIGGGSALSTALFRNTAVCAPSEESQTTPKGTCPTSAAPGTRNN